MSHAKDDQDRQAGIGMPSPGQVGPGNAGNAMRAGRHGVTNRCLTQNGAA